MNKTKIVILDNFVLCQNDLHWDKLNEYFDVEIHDRTAQENVISTIGDSTMVFTNKAIIDKAIIDNCSNLKYIGVMATGYNVVDTQYAKQKGIVVTNVPSYSTNSVAQCVFAMLLEICHKIGVHDGLVKKGDWCTNKDFCFYQPPLIEIAGKNFGIIGFGAIGKQVATIAKAFNMNVLVYTRHPKKELEDDNLHFVDFETLLHDSDYISLHCPLTKENEFMINEQSLKLMKKTVVLINTARGGLVDELAVKNALNNDEIYYFACDVISCEPMEKDNPLLQAKHTIITPHIAWATKEARSRLIDIATDNAISFINGKPINVVNK